MNLVLSISTTIFRQCLGRVYPALISSNVVRVLGERLSNDSPMDGQIDPMFTMVLHGHLRKNMTDLKIQSASVHV